MQMYSPGYAMHWIHARQLAIRPWGWRPAILTTVDGGSATAAYLTEDGTVTLWHHKPLVAEIGEPVRVHEEFHAVEIHDAWLNVRIEDGIGAVPDPRDATLWAPEVPHVIVNAAIGDGIRISPELVRRQRNLDG
ncbi:MAG TPA: hypothetical protein VLB29_13195 [Nocardioidaceae bacterium]|nr:hypothetical protein [Nocardioidaceae bacterium]